MIYGIGTDIVAVARMTQALERHGERFAERILSDEEMQGFKSAPHPARFLAKRFAAKEAAAKALGTGFRDGLSLRHIWVGHSELGQPKLQFCEQAVQMCAQRQIGAAHLSIADEHDYAVAFVTLMQKSDVNYK